MTTYKNIILVLLILQTFILQPFGDGIGKEAAAVLGRDAATIFSREGAAHVGKDAAVIVGTAIENTGAAVTKTVIENASAASDKMSRQVQDWLNSSGGVLQATVDKIATEARATGAATAQQIHRAVTTTGDEVCRALDKTQAAISTANSEFKSTATSLIDSITNSPRTMMPYFKHIPIWTICSISAFVGIMMTKKGIEQTIDNSAPTHQTEKRTYKRGILYTAIGATIFLASVTTLVNSEYFIQ